MSESKQVCPPGLYIVKDDDEYFYLAECLEDDRGWVIEGGDDLSPDPLGDVVKGPLNLKEIALGVTAETKIPRNEWLRGLLVQLRKALRLVDLIESDAYAVAHNAGCRCPRCEVAGVIVAAIANVEEAVA